MGIVTTGPVICAFGGFFCFMLLLLSRSEWVKWVGRRRQMRRVGWDETAGGVKEVDDDGLDEVRRIGCAALPGRARGGLLQFTGRHQFRRLHDAPAAPDRPVGLDLCAGLGAGRLPYRPQRRPQRHVQLHVDVVPAGLHRRHLQVLARQRLVPPSRPGAGRPKAGPSAPPHRWRLALPVTAAATCPPLPQRGRMRLPARRWLRPILPPIRPAAFGRIRAHFPLLRLHDGPHRGRHPRRPVRGRCPFGHRLRSSPPLRRPRRLRLVAAQMPKTQSADCPAERSHRRRQAGRRRAGASHYRVETEARKPEAILAQRFPTGTHRHRRFYFLADGDDARHPFRIGSCGSRRVGQEETVVYTDDAAAASLRSSTISSGRAGREEETAITETKAVRYRPAANLLLISHPPPQQLPRFARYRQH